MNLTNIFSSINPREVIKNLPDAVLVVDFDGKIIWSNNKAAVIFESNSNDLKGLYLNEIVANGMELAQKSFSRRNSIVTGAFTFAGKEFFIEMNAKKYIDQYFITIRDITAMTNVLKNAEKTGRLNKEKNTMLVKLSSEFKSPIQSVIGFSQAILDGLGGDITEKQSKYLKIINKNSNELLYFVDKFIEFSQAESSLFTINNQFFDITNLIQLIIKNNDKEIRSKGLAINIDHEELPQKTIYSDETALNIIIQNIIENSIKLTETGSITIKLEIADDETLEKCNLKMKPEINYYLKISISDTGMGLAKSEMEGLYEPYTQLANIQKKNIVRALSLGTAQTIVKKMMGHFEVSSEVMIGTTFTVILPLCNKIGDKNE